MVTKGKIVYLPFWIRDLGYLTDYSTIIFNSRY